MVRDLIRHVVRAAEANGAHRVLEVKVWLGALSHLSTGHFREHFESEARGTLAEGARLSVTESSDTSDPRAQSLLLESLELEA
jgi:hydrogenase nickel incorporation protein HypA/HybF